ncbi:hypothetical protein F4827_000485 [Paraburkholderia bannensis]|uniref:Uncharacterized protein n=1 Tax=Paraburkholderia bannensis TaxID=765414 RepID=A0A7W9TSH6_9BURK|nr:MULTISPECIES: hypothetical protein [Paraburkholderia]MBB3255307.1 hypothetical protein [Paraburkholderia sp. WP4_3_2]MBB6100681.1 hypothetical protein [Paraburkholderia bannensis]
MKNVGNVGIGRAVQGPRAVRTDAENIGKNRNKNSGKNSKKSRSLYAGDACAATRKSGDMKGRNQHRGVVRRKSAHCKDLARRACVAYMKSAQVRPEFPKKADKRYASAGLPPALRARTDCALKGKAVARR